MIDCLNMEITKPSKNKITGTYSSNHKGFDFSGKGDPGVYACLDGEVIVSVDRYVNAWRNTGRLTTRDYGNYCIVRHENKSYGLHAHLARGTAPKVGQRVKEGQRIATIGNTGNSTGPHLHFEFRNASNINQKVDFKEEDMPSSEDTIQLGKAKFEELVTKASRFDAFKAEGWENPNLIKKVIKDLKEDLKRERETNGDTAQEWKKTHQNFMRDLANTLGTAQREVEVLASVRKALNAENEFLKEKPQYSKDRKEWLDKETSLKDEIVRLTAMLKYQEVLQNSSLEELIRELIKRFTQLLKS